MAVYLEEALNFKQVYAYRTIVKCYFYILNSTKWCIRDGASTRTKIVIVCCPVSPVTLVKGSEKYRFIY